MDRVREGKLDPSKVEEYRKENPLPETESQGLERIKQEIRETNIEYKESIQRNKDLYEELETNRKRKAELRDRLAELRKKKKEILGK